MVQQGTVAGGSRSTYHSDSYSFRAGPMNNKHR